MINATRIKAKYPLQLKQQVDSVKKQLAEKQKNVTISFTGDLDDKLSFDQAVWFYVNNPTT